MNRNNILYLIILFALALRFYGINFEVPHPDDHITVQGAMHFGPAQVTPTGYGLYGLYVWPAFTLVIIQTVLFSLYFFIGSITDSFASIESFRNLYLTDPSSFYLIGRIMCVAFGVGTVWILYYLARRLYNHKVGLLTSLILSVSFIHSFHSQFIRPDIPSLFLIILVLICCLKILDKGSIRYYVFAGILTGLATATKFTSVIVILPIFLVHLMFEEKCLAHGNNRFSGKNVLPMAMIIIGLIISAGSVFISGSAFHYLKTVSFSPHADVNSQFLFLLKKLVNSGVFFGVALILIGGLAAYSSAAKHVISNLLFEKKLYSCLAAIIISFVIFDPLFFLDLKYQIRIFLTDPNFMGKKNTFVGIDSLGFWGNLLWYFKGPVNWGLGFHFIIMAALGLLHAMLEKRKESLVIIAFILVYLMVIGTGKFRWERYAIVLMPFIALYSASFIYTFLEKLFSAGVSAQSMNFTISLIAITIIILPTYNILRYDYLLTQKDTRVIAKEWVEINLKPGSKIGQDAYTGDLSDKTFQIYRKFSLSYEPIDFYIKNGFDYLLVSDTQYNRYLGEAKKYPQNVEFYRELFSKGNLIKEFTPNSDLWPKAAIRFSKYHIHISPIIKVFKVN